jgi:predicted PhzF superfamily epimerase YddE/YHI9
MARSGSVGRRVVQVDAFTDEPFTGNPAAVCVLDRPPDEKWMQRVAREMNLSETAFCVPRDDGFDLRWFTPTVEVELCGHATLASAHVLWEDGHTKSGERIRFHTRWSGELTADRDGDWIVLDFPSRPATEGAIDAAVIDAIGGEPVRTARGVVGGGFSGYLLEYATEAEVRALGPRFGEFPDDGYVTVTAPADMPGYDFVSRFFAPPAGIDEDPVTGSTHCTLGPWWAEHLGKDELMAFQASDRGGTLRVTVAGDRVGLGGKAVTVMRGELV